MEKKGFEWCAGGGAWPVSACMYGGWGRGSHRWFGVVADFGVAGDEQRVYLFLNGIGGGFCNGQWDFLFVIKNDFPAPRTRISSRQRAL